MKIQSVTVEGDVTTSDEETKSNPINCAFNVKQSLWGVGRAVVIHARNLLPLPGFLSSRGDVDDINRAHTSCRGGIDGARWHLSHGILLRLRAVICSLAALERSRSDASLELPNVGHDALPTLSGGANQWQFYQEVLGATD
jgi:hypothetical protein